MQIPLLDLVMLRRKRRTKRYEQAEYAGNLLFTPNHGRQTGKLQPPCLLYRGSVAPWTLVSFRDQIARLTIVEKSLSYCAKIL